MFNSSFVASWRTHSLSSLKSEFHARTVSFLGYVVSAGNIKMDPAKVSAVTSWHVPDCRRKLQQFLGFASFYRRFIENYSSIATPLLP